MMDEEELRRQRILQARKAALPTQVAAPPTSAPAVGLRSLGDNSPGPTPWGEGGACLGLKILCGVLGAIIVALVVVLIVKMVHRNPRAQDSAQSPGQSQLPMSLAGGFDPMGESLLSTGSV